MGDALRVRIRNVLGVTKADFVIEEAKVTLIAGINAAGKSSVLEAIWACLLSDPAIRGLRNKTLQAMAIHDGAGDGVVMLDYGNGGKVVLSYPGSEMTQTGRVAFLGTPLGTGKVRFTALDEKGRQGEFSARALAAPTLNDLVAWYKANPGSGLEDPENLDHAKQLWADLDTSGWDAVANRVKDHGIKKRGAWEHLTNTKFGTAKSPSWCPVGIDPNIPYDLPHELNRLTGLRANLEKMTTEAAMAAIDTTRLKKAIQAAEEASKLVADTQQERTAIQAQIDAKQTERRAMHVPPTGLDTALKCPHCNQRVIVNKDAKGYTIIDKAPPPPDDKTLKTLRAKAGDLEKDIGVLEGESEKLAERMISLRTTMEAGKRADAELARVKAAPAHDAEALEFARSEVLAAERLVGLLRTWYAARELYAEWARNTKLLEGLAPTGVRKAVLDVKLSAVNAEVATLCETLRIREVSLDADMGVYYGGRPYQLCSESERWRTDLVLGVLFWKREKAVVYMADRFDVVVATERGGIVYGLKKLGVTAVLAMTNRDRETVPDMGKTKMGAALWLDGGTLGACH